MASAKQPKTAMVGCGYWGRNLARNFAELGALAAICDPDPETAAREAGKYNVPALSFEEALADPEIAAVAIAAPAELHADLALKAFDASKHVYVEKPLALTRNDAEAMIAAADKAGKLLMVGHLLQYHTAFEALLKAVRADEIGALRYVYSHRLSLGKFRQAENALWSFAPHDVSMIQALFGASPVSVTGNGAGWVSDGVEDACRVDMTFDGGGRAHIFASWLHPFKEHRLVVVGETGMMVFEDSAPEPENKLRLYRHEIVTGDGDPQGRKADPAPYPYEAAEPLKRECAHFLQCVASGARPRTDGKEGLAVLDTLLRAENA